MMKQFFFLSIITLIGISFFSFPLKENAKAILPLESHHPILVYTTSIPSVAQSTSLKTTPIQKPIERQEESDCSIPADLSIVPIEVKTALEKNFKSIPCSLIQSLRIIEIFDDPSAPRAMAGRTILKIRKDVVFAENLEQVLFHELGHIVDLGGLQGTPEYGNSAFWDGSIAIYQNDISLLFYQISWNDSTTKKEGVSRLDFVSGYGASDVFEDFAESFLYYREHGNEFRLLAEQNDSLSKKYEFLKEYIFNGKEFFTGKNYVETQTRPWDATSI
jgi:hypothetical protein